MKTRIALGWTLLFCLCFTQNLWSQCTMGGTFDNDICTETIRTYNYAWSCASGHCRYDFPAAITGHTFLYRTATTATYYVGRNASYYNSVFVSCYDSVFNCTGYMDWTDHHRGNWTYPDITGSIPVCPVPAQIYIYIAHRWGPTSGFMPTESLNWSITGGTIQSITSSLPISSQIYDTVKVTWNPAGPHRLISTRSGTANGIWGTYNCTNRDTLDDGVTPPTIYGAPALCGTTTGNYSIASLDPNFTHAWSCSNGTITAGQGTANVTVNWTGSGTLTLTRTAIPCGWTSVSTKNVTISASAAPVPNLGPNLTPCTGQSVPLNPGTFSTYRWSNQWVSQTIAPTTSGNYSVTVTNAAGCVAADTVTLTFVSGPTPNLGPNQTVCMGTPVTLNAGTYTSYIWSTGATTQTISPTSSGNYSVTVTNSSGCQGSDAAIVSFLASPTPNLGANQSVCVGTPVTLNPGTFTSYAWSTGATTQTISLTTSGTYSVTVTNSNGCTGSSSMTLTVNANPVPNLGSNQSVCVGTPVTLNPGAFSTYAWSTGATTSTISPTTSGTYSVTVTDANGCTGSSSMTLTFNANPVPNLGANQSVCVGTPVTLNPGTFTSYAWSTGATTSTISPTTSGTYSVTVTDANGCTGSSSMTLTFNANPVPNLGPNQSVCAGTVVTLNAGIFTSYSWSTGATTYTISPTTSGTYSVTVTNASGCTGTSTMTLAFFPNPVVNLGNDTIICADTTISLNGPAGMASYNWSTSATTQNIVVATGGTYSLTVTDANGCTANDDILIQGLTDCVFPGDANYDGVADNLDVLSIGVYYGTTGATRANATTQWYGQNIADWGGALPGNADPKHSDCNGDGTIQANDTLAVTLNYGQTHSKADEISTAGADLRVVALQDSIVPGGVAWFSVMLGDALNQADSVYGLAFTVNYSTLPVATPGLLTVDYSQCWYAGNGLRLNFTHNPVPLSPADLAVVRNDGAQQIGFGEVCRLAILTDSNLIPQNSPLVVSLTNVHMVDAQLGPQAVAVFADSTVVTHLGTSLNGGAVTTPPRVYPNPSDDLVRIDQAGAKLQHLELFDANGRMVLSLPLADRNSVEVLTSAFPAGIYALRIVSEGGVYYHKLCIRH